MRVRVEASSLPGLREEAQLLTDVTLELDRRFTVADFVCCLQAMNKVYLRIIKIGVAVLPIRCNRINRWIIGDDPTVTLLPEGMEPTDTIVVDLLYHTVHDSATWLAAFEKGMHSTEIPDERKCVGTPINYVGGAASLILYDGWHQLPEEDQLSFMHKTGIRVMIDGTRRPRVIFYHEQALKSVWMRLKTGSIELQRLVPELLSDPISLVKMCMDPVRKEDTIRMSLIHILFDDVRRRMARRENILPEICAMFDVNPPHRLDHRPSFVGRAKALGIRAARIPPPPPRLLALLGTDPQTGVKRRPPPLARAPRHHDADSDDRGAARCATRPRHFGPAVDDWSP